ncbi:MAG: hypothetical protein AB7K64_01150 [Variibacter sp.]
MTACPIFASMSAAAQIAEESDALVEELCSALNEISGGRIAVEQTKWISEDEYRRWTARLSIRVVQKGRKPRLRNLTVHFDLFREVPASGARWTHATESILVVGFDPVPPTPDRGWSSSLLAIDASGRLDDDDAWSNCKESQFANGKLLEWRAESVGENWSQRAWVFAMPLRIIKDHNVVREHLAKPIIALLTDTPPEEALASSAVITWALPEL